MGFFKTTRAISAALSDVFKSYPEHSVILETLDPIEVFYFDMLPLCLSDMLTLACFCGLWFQ